MRAGSAPPFLCRHAPSLRPRRSSASLVLAAVQGEGESALGVLRQSLKAQGHAADTCTVQAMLRLCQTDIYGDSPDIPAQDLPAPQGQVALPDCLVAAPAWPAEGGIPEREGLPRSSRLVVLRGRGAHEGEVSGEDGLGDGLEHEGEEEAWEGDGEEEEEGEEGGAAAEGGLDVDERGEAWRAMRQSDVIARLEAVDDFMTTRGLKHTRASFATLVRTPTPTTPASPVPRCTLQRLA